MGEVEDGSVVVFDLILAQLDKKQNKRLYTNRTQPILGVVLYK